MWEQCTVQLNIDANRKAEKWTRAELVARALWQLAHPLFALSPHICWGWRRWLLRLFGAVVGRDAHIYPSARIAVPWNLEIGDQSAVGDRTILYSLGRIRLGRQVTVSQYA